MSEQFSFNSTVPEIHAGKRLDQVLALLCPDHSRSRLATWIKSGYVTLNGSVCEQVKLKVSEGDSIAIEAVIEDAISMEPEPLPLDIVYEDSDVIVVNKAAGVVVHPAAGNPSGTLLNALLHHCPELTKIPRAGIVHRLDKGTTGLMMIAKTLSAHTSLVAQLQDRTVKRVYHAVVFGTLRRKTGTIDASMGRHPQNRIKMAVLDDPEAKVAITHYEAIDALEGSTLVQCKLETGRTHQIRVHMAHIGHPLIGDETYAGRQRYPAGLSPVQRQQIDVFARPALHAKQLSFTHPKTNEQVSYSIDYPKDFSELLFILKKN